MDAHHRSRGIASALGFTVVILAVLTLLAGLPSSDQLVNFLIGVGVLIGVLLGVGLLGWHLLVRPLPANLQVTPQSLVGSTTRSLVALLLTLGTLSIGIAGVWDEIWHSKYGIPFGKDFFWRPHLMLYFSFLTLVGVGIWSWWILMSRGKGTLQQRFRSSPILGVSFLAGLFTIYAVGADPIWHRLYGSDIAPWSLPHLMILVMILFMGILTIAYHKSLMEPREWGLKFQMNWRNVLIALVLVGGVLDFMLIFTIQWYAAVSSEKQLTQILRYPDWLLAVFLTFLATLFGIIALRATRQVGMATLVGIMAFAVRFLLDNGLGGVRVGTTPLLIIVPLMLSLDLWYAIVLSRTQKPPAFWTTAIVVAVVFGVVGLPVLAANFPHPPVTAATIPGMIIASLLTALASVWFGQLLGDMNNADNKTTIAQSAGSANWVTTVGLYAAYAVLLLVFVVTAVPPA